MENRDIPIIEMPDVQPGCWYYLNADAWQAGNVYEGLQRVLPPEYQGMVIVCATGMKEQIKAKLQPSE